MRTQRLAAAIVCVFAFAAACAAQPTYLRAKDVVLFQGDSITDGGRWRTGQDLNHIMGQDYAYIVSGRLGAERPDLDLTFLNRGVGGETVLDLAARWKTDVLALRPDVLSVLIGVNDTLASRRGGETVEQYEHAYDQLLAETLAALPGIRIVLGEPFLLPVGRYAADYPAQRAKVQQHGDAVRRLAAKYHLPVVSYQAVFDQACQRSSADHWSWDGVHPTYAGHWLMAEAWIKATSAAWDK